MPDLIPILQQSIDHQSKPGVSARFLYEFLGLNPTAYARWAKKNIVNNAYALEHLDWDITRPDVEYRIEARSPGQLSQDYALSIDFAKRLAMMARSAKGEEARQYFLTCEKTALAAPSLPTLHDPVAQALMHLLIDHDATKYRLAAIEQDNALLRRNDERIEAKADAAVQNQNFWTIAEYVQYHDLRRQCPETAYVEASRHLQGYCKQQRLNYRDPNIVPRRISVGEKQWETEWGFHTSVYEEAFTPWILRRNSQVMLVPQKVSEF